MNICRLVLSVCLVLSSQLFARDLRFDSQVDSTQIMLLQEDLNKLAKLLASPSVVDQELKEVMDVSTLDASTLKEWLTERIGWIVPEDFDPMREFYSTKAVSYPLPFTFPTFDEEQVTPVPESNAMITVMANIGAAQYLIGKSKRQLFAFKFSDEFGAEEIPMNSPRQGVVKIGQGLFHPKLNYASEDMSRDVNSIMRLATLFHEARHSDGQGESLGFFHAVCPTGHKYQGKSVCDKNLNGPYMLDGLLIKKLMASCEQCSQEEKAFLTNQSEESLSRVLTSYFVSDYTPEVKKQVEDLEAMKETYMAQWSQPNLSPRQEMMINNAIESIERRIAALYEKGEKVKTEVPTTLWAALPEFLTDF